MPCCALLLSHVQLFATPWTVARQASLFVGDSPSKITRVGCCAFFQGIFPTQGSNPGLPHCRLILYCLSHQGSPRILEWIAGPFSRGSSWPRSQTRVFFIAGRIFTSWATNSFSFFKTKNILLISHFWITVLPDIEFLVDSPFFPINMPSRGSLASKVSEEKLAYNSTQNHCMWQVLSLTAFKISLCL